MKASELITELQELINEHGDQDVVANDGELGTYEAGVSYDADYFPIHKAVFAIDLLSEYKRPPYQQPQGK